jgi:hypothetical protein
MNSHLPLHEQAQLFLSPERLDRELELFPAREVVWERILCLASLARAIDPTLGRNLRFAKRAPLEIESRNAVDFDIVFTQSQDRTPSLADTEARRRSPLAADRDVSFEDALRRVLPAEVVDHELRLIAGGPAEGFASGTAAAIQEAFIKGHISIHSEEIVREDADAEREVWVTSDPYAVSDTQFMRHATVARWVWMAKNAHESAADSRISPAVNAIRQDVLRVREILNRSFAHVNTDEKAEVVDAIARLNLNRNARPSFEDAFDHSWVGYALARRNGEGWSDFLIEKARCNPNGHYAGETPVVIAIAQDDGISLKSILGAGISPSAMLNRFPEVYDAATQKSLEGREEVSIPLVLYATVIQAKKAVRALLQAGATADITSDRGSFPLMEAAYRVDTPMVRTLLEEGANPFFEDADGYTADAYVPMDGPDQEKAGKPLLELIDRAKASRTAVITAAKVQDAVAARRAAMPVTEADVEPFPSADGLTASDIRSPRPLASKGP